jgi:hypothetical protein
VHDDLIKKMTEKQCVEYVIKYQDQLEEIPDAKDKNTQTLNNVIKLVKSDE